MCLMTRAHPILVFLIAAATGWFAGLPLCLGTYNLLDRLWPHDHCSQTENYLWSGIGGAFLGQWLLLYGGTASGIGAGAIVLAIDSAASLRPVILLVPGVLGMLLNAIMILTRWHASVHHSLLLQYGFPTLISLVLFHIGVMLFTQQQKASACARRE